MVVMVNAAIAVVHAPTPTDEYRLLGNAGAHCCYRCAASLSWPDTATAAVLDIHSTV
jgi:hypothetical protein